MIFKKVVVGLIALGMMPRLTEASECDCHTPAPTKGSVTGFPSISSVSAGETRTIVVKNSCSFDLHLGFTGGFAGSAPCTKNQVEDELSGRCFWSLDFTEGLGAGEHFSTTIDHGDDDGLVLFSGNVWGTRDIDGICANDLCNAWTGPVGSLTKVEFTFLVGDNSVDFINVSMVDGGAYLPVSMKPEGFEKVDSDGYEFPGDCAWDFDPGEDFMYLVEVQDGDGSCMSHDDCSDRHVCGVSFAESEPRYGVCGTHVGYSNALANCMRGSTSPKFECEKYFDVYACQGEWGNSGYTPGLDVEHVCGCTSFPDIPGLQYSFPCVNSDDVWTKVALPWAYFLKRGCPSAFTYAYDDSASSLFTFEASSYEIEMCPGDSENSFYI